MKEAQTVWITGASSGIGEALALTFNAKGYQTILSARRTEVLQSLQQRLDYPEQCYLLPLDLEQHENAEVWTHQALAFTGSIDILINNAGALVNRPFSDITKEDLMKVYGTNVFGPIQLIQNLMPKFSSDAHIVNISSVGGVTGSVKFPGLSAYSSSKGALTILTECLQAEFGDSTSWSFNCLALGAV